MSLELVRRQVEVLPLYDRPLALSINRQLQVEQPLPLRYHRVPSLDSSSPQLVPCWSGSSAHASSMVLASLDRALLVIGALRVVQAV